jgi:hypothetical protein
MSSTIPKFFTLNTKDYDLGRVQDNLVRTLDPLVNTPILAGNLLQNIPLVIGANIVNHKLGRNLVGWIIVRQRAAASVYDTQDTNKTPNLNLTLISNAVAVVDLYVF